MPEGAIYVGRPSIYGNPFRIGDSLVAAFTDASAIADGIEVTRENCLVLFELWVRQQSWQYPLWLKWLHGKDLACWCKESEPCHADVLIRLANP